MPNKYTNLKPGREFKLVQHNNYLQFPFIFTTFYCTICVPTHPRLCFHFCPFGLYFILIIALLKDGIFGVLFYFILYRIHFAWHVLGSHFVRN